MITFMPVLEPAYVQQDAQYEVRPTLISAWSQWTDSLNKEFARADLPSIEVHFPGRGITTDIARHTIVNLRRLPGRLSTSSDKERAFTILKNFSDALKNSLDNRLPYGLMKPGDLPSKNVYDEIVRQILPKLRNLATVEDAESIPAPVSSTQVVLSTMDQSCSPDLMFQQLIGLPSSDNGLPPRVASANCERQILYYSPRSNAAFQYEQSQIVETIESRSNNTVQQTAAAPEEPKKYTSLVDLQEKVGQLDSKRVDTQVDLLLAWASQFGEKKNSSSQEQVLAFIVLCSATEKLSPVEKTKILTLLVRGIPEIEQSKAEQADNEKTFWRLLSDKEEAAISLQSFTNTRPLNQDQGGTISLPDVDGGETYNAISNAIAQSDSQHSLAAFLTLARSYVNTK